MLELNLSNFRITQQESENPSSSPKILSTTLSQIDETSGEHVKEELDSEPTSPEVS